jgi:hypothetical protein
LLCSSSMSSVLSSSLNECRMRSSMGSMAFNQFFFFFLFLHFSFFFLHTNIFGFRFTNWPSQTRSSHTLNRRGWTIEK